MKFIYTTLFLFYALSCVAQVPDYYDNVNISLTGSALQTELSDKVATTQTTVLSYTPGVWNALKQADRDPSNANKVILIYGYNDSDGVLSTDRTRARESNGGASTDWNREHVYPRSLGVPNLGSTGPGSDAHHLRPSDPARNGTRSNRKFAAGAGTSSVTAQGNFYPGDEWKGDVARMMLFMYVRYGNRCLPNNVAVGVTNSIDGNMVNVLLDWNVQDPVSSFELNRNEVIQGIQGNRNPFIDNPAFATAIWGGPQAEDRFGNTGGGGTTAEIDVRLRITFDNYPEETSWEIRTDNNVLVYSGGTYGSQGDGSTININRTLDAGCYKLIFKDTYGDGICCSYGNGSYQFFNEETGNTITSGGSFGSSQTRTFCLGTKQATTSNNTFSETRSIEESVFKLHPNPASDYIYITTGVEQQGAFIIINQLGQVVKKGERLPKSISVQGWKTGLYFLQTQSATGINTVRFLVK